MTALNESLSRLPIHTNIETEIVKVLAMFGAATLCFWSFARLTGSISVRAFSDRSSSALGQQ